MRMLCSVGQMACSQVGRCGEYFIYKRLRRSARITRGVLSTSDNIESIVKKQQILKCQNRLNFKFSNSLIPNDKSSVKYSHKLH